jgi:hypothetical protein
MHLKQSYFRIREKIRRNGHVAACIYRVQSVLYSNFGSFRRQVIRTSRRLGIQSPSGVALCCRIRDEARFLGEWMEYYLAAGVRHVFFYEKLSQDNFREVLRPYIDRGLVTLIEDWPNVPVSPSADHDCILQALGRFEWVGFIDADEFVVIKDNRTIGEFLADHSKKAAVALHWYMFGSNGHKERPAGPVIAEYVRREKNPNIHVKCFVQPASVARFRNSHSWYYRGMRCAVNENGSGVRGSVAFPPTAQKAWINHYHTKSEQDYFEKAARKSVLDTVGIRYNTRTAERLAIADPKANAIVDDCAARYYAARCEALGIRPYGFLTLSAHASV